jgi:hypothetical protein
MEGREQHPQPYQTFADSLDLLQQMLQICRVCNEALELVKFHP